MSLEQLRELDNYHFFIRIVSQSIKLSSVPFFVKPCGTTFVLSMLRDIDFCFDMNDGDSKEFELLAVKKEDGDTKNDAIRRAYMGVKRGGDTNISVCTWKITFNESEDSDDSDDGNQRWFHFRDLKIRFWYKWVSNGSYWFFGNPEIVIKTAKLVESLCL